MRRRDREVKNFDEIISIIDRADTIRLGLNGDPYPYVVPLSFGYEAEGGKINFYFHGASEGFKHELIKKNPLVCVEADIFHRYVKTDGGGTTDYESFIGFGDIIRVTGAEVEKGMDLIFAHCGLDGGNYDRAKLNDTAIYRITAEKFTGKRRVV